MNCVATAGRNGSLLILAGGESRRMGKTKALLATPPTGLPLIQLVAERLLPLVGQGIVVANDKKVCEALRCVGNKGEGASNVAALRGQRVTCVPDDEPGLGPLEGLATGLRRIEGWSLTVAGDMPFVSGAVCSKLLALADKDFDAVVPVVEGQAQPLHALYHSNCLPAIEFALAAGRRRMDSFLPNLRVRTVTQDSLRPLDPQLQTFVNVNTPGEWREACAILSRG